jgi:excisionase family DNA binding protein
MPGGGILALQRIWQHPWQHVQRKLGSMSKTSPESDLQSELLDVAGAARHLGVTVVFVRRLVMERRIRYYKLGKFVRFRIADLDAFVEGGRIDPTIRRRR